MSMTNEQFSKCQEIIHTAAVASGVGKLVPVLFLGTSVNIGAMYLMAEQLIELFGEGNAYGTVTSSITSGMAKKEAKKLAKELVTNALEGSAVSSFVEDFMKCIPGINFIGAAVGSAMTVNKVEKVGWRIAGELYEKNTSGLRKFWNNIWYHNEF